MAYLVNLHSAVQYYIEIKRVACAIYGREMRAVARAVMQCKSVARVWIVAWPVVLQPIVEDKINWL